MKNQQSNSIDSISDKYQYIDVTITAFWFYIVVSPSVDIVITMNNNKLPRNSTQISESC